MKKKNILIIDDDMLVIEMIAVLLADKGYQTTMADSAENGLNGFMEAGYDLVLSDIFMEGMGGIEGIAQMRAMNPGIPIIAISAGYKGMAPGTALKAAGKIGAVGTLAKPIDPEKLFATVEVLLRKRECL